MMLCEMQRYDKVTVAPRSANVFFNFSASSFGRFSLTTFGTDSTNFFAYLNKSTMRLTVHKDRTYLHKVGVRYNTFDFLDNLSLRRSVKFL